MRQDGGRDAALHLPPPSRLYRDRNLPALLLGFMYRNFDLQHPVFEFGLRLIGLRARRQGNHTVEVPVDTFGPVIAAFGLPPLLALLALYDDPLVGAFHFHIVLLQAWKLGRYLQVPIALPHLDG